MLAVLDCPPGREDATIGTVSHWVEHCIFWHAFPLRFLGAEPHRLSAQAPIQHRLPRLEPWLDYLIELGASGLLLGPIFESESHGYDTVDHLAIDLRLGDMSDFDRLVSAAQQRGIRVLLDGVFNHVGREHPAFQEVLRDGPAASSAELFQLYWKPGQDEPDYDHFEGHRRLVTLNHASPAVADLVVEAMCHWLDRGADGWRLDAAYAVPPAFWASVLPRVRARHPQAYVVGEVIHGDYPAIVAASGMDAVTQYELWKAMWSSINDHNFHELAWTLQRHDALLETFVPMTFVGNHDVTRIATKIEDSRHLAHALVVLFTVGGTPCVYSGDEQGFRGTKFDRPGGDDEVRPAFPAHPDELSRLGEPVLNLHKQLIALRRQHPWLHHARLEVTHVANDQIVYRSTGEGRVIVVALNLAEEPARVPVPAVRDVLAGWADGASPGGSDVTVAANGWAVLGG